ncbi:unnamed protein product, partial [Mesorhabditis spiculigera]
MDDKGKTLECSQCPKGYSCEKDLCCASKEKACEVEYDSGKYMTGRAHIPKYFHSKQLSTCILFTYYGSMGNANNFDTFHQCEQFCAK